MAFDPAQNVWQQSYRVVDDVTEIVKDRMDDAVATAEDLRNKALEVIDGMKTVQFNTPGPVPAPPIIDTTVDISLDIPPIAVGAFGTISAPTHSLAMPDLDAIPTIVDVTIDDFVPADLVINIPNAPAPIVVGSAPTEPVLEDITLPTAPVLAFPDLPLLDQSIAIPDFEFPTLPTFDAVAPSERDIEIVDAAMSWTEPTYTTEILDEVLVVVRRMWGGDSGLPQHIEDAMYARVADREDRLVEQQVNQTMEEFSLRGFTSPTGTMAARIDNIRNDGMIKKQGGIRELSIKIADVHVENLRFAVQQAIAAEQVLVNIFLNGAQRLFEAMKYNVEAKIAVYNAQVTLFNARQMAYKTRADVYKTELEATLSYIEVFKAQVEGEMAKGRLNEQLVSTYKVQNEALQTRVNIYTAEMQGASIQSEMGKNQIDAYRAKVQAFSERISADKVRFDAYNSQVQGEAAKAGVMESMARAYAATVSGKVAQIDAQKTKIDAVIASNKGQIDAFMAGAEVDKHVMEMELARIKAGVEAYSADTQRYIAQAGVEEAKANLQVEAKKAELSVTIAYYEAQVRAYVANMEALMRQAALVADGMKATGELTATLAAGAMAGVNIGASLSGSGSVAASGTGSESFSTSNSYSESHNYSHEGA